VATSEGIEADLVGDLIIQAVEQRIGANSKADGDLDGWLITAVATRRRRCARLLGNSD